MAKTGENPNKKKVDLVALAARKDAREKALLEKRTAVVRVYLLASSSYYANPTVKGYRRYATAISRMNKLR